MNHTRLQKTAMHNALVAYVQSGENLAAWLRAASEARAAGLMASGVAEQVGVSTRAVYNALRIAEYVEAARISDEDVQELGITRLVVLAHQTRPEDYRKHWRKEALSLRRRQLERHVQGKSAEMVSMLFLVSERERAFIAKCLETVGAEVVSSDSGRMVMHGKDQALVRVFREWHKQATA